MLWKLVGSAFGISLRIPSSLGALPLDRPLRQMS